MRGAAGGKTGGIGQVSQGKGEKNVQEKENRHAKRAPLPLQQTGECATINIQLAPGGPNIGRGPYAGTKKDVPSGCF